MTAFDPPSIFEWTVGDLECPVSRWSFLIDHAVGVTTLTHRVVLCGGPSPLSELVAQHPAGAEEMIRERLETLRGRMAVTIDGLLAIATSGAHLP